MDAAESAKIRRKLLTCGATRRALSLPRIGAKVGASSIVEYFERGILCKN
jgi:hypothetical protein